MQILAGACISYKVPSDTNAGGTQTFTESSEDPGSVIEPRICFQGPIPTPSLASLELRGHPQIL